MALDRTRPALVGILNLTDDSFAGDGVGGDLDAALRRADAMCDEGADWLDVGAESSRPGAVPIAAEVERDRVGRAVEALCRRVDVAIAVDTRRPSTAMAALAAGATMVNDTSGWPCEAMAAAVRAHGARWVLMHVPHAHGAMAPSQAVAGMPGGLLAGIARVADDLAMMRDVALAFGVDRDALIADPGLGFGKTVAQNLALLLPQPRLQALGLPLYLGPSRKSVLGVVTARAVEARLPATVVAVAAAASAGAAYVRVHDVAAARDALAMAMALAEVDRSLGDATVTAG